MALATIDIKPGFSDRGLISEDSPQGVLVKTANSTPIDFVGKEYQTIDFSGEMGIFGEGSPDAAAEEKTKSSNDATNGKLTIFPVTLQASYRVPKKFLAIFGVDGYNPSAPTYNAGAPASMLEQALQQPYQKGILEQYSHYTNRMIGRALDYLGIYGINPQTKKASAIARQNDYLLKAAAPISYTPGTGPQAAQAFNAAVRAVAENGDTAAQGIVNPAFLAAIQDGETNIGSQTQYAAQIPLIGSQVSLGGVTLYAGSTVADATAATAAGVASTNVLDAIIGDYQDRFVWGMNLLSGIEVFDSGNPDNSSEGDLAAVNKVLLRTEIALAWGFIGGTDKFMSISHTKA